MFCMHWTSAWTTRGRSRQPVWSCAEGISVTPACSSSSKRCRPRRPGGASKTGTTSTSCSRGRACSIARSRSRGMPSLAAAAGEFPLPADTRCLEDGVTAADSRGTGIGPQCITFIIDALKAEGVRWVVVKAAVDNISSRRPIEKGGFEEMARLRHERWGRRSHSSLRPTDESAPHCLAMALAPELRRGTAREPGLAKRRRAH